MLRFFLFPVISCIINLLSLIFGDTEIKDAILGTINK